MFSLAMVPLVLWVATPGCQALDNGLAITPPMGWRSWERFQCNTDCQTYPDDCLSEKLIKTTADAMSQNALSSVGYEYIMLDDCWMNRTRNTNGELIGDVKRFPSGMKSLADYVHNKGLKLGLRLSTGNTTCNGYPGSQGKFQQDANTVTGWGVDMVTLDGCNTAKVDDFDSLYPQMGQYLNKTGRRVLYECLWPSYSLKVGRQVDWGKVSSVCNFWRMREDPLIDSWNSLEDTIKYFHDNLRVLTNYTGPGSWNYMDQLLMGNFGLSLNQLRMQMAIWSITSSPLFVSADVRHLTSEAAAILLNKRAIAINQDPLGIMGQVATVRGQLYIWKKPISPPGSFALAFMYINVSGGPTKVTLKLTDIGIEGSAAYNFTDVFTGDYLGTVKPWYTYNCEVNPVGVLYIHALALP